jgi:hypothetical protein
MGVIINQGLPPAARNGNEGLGVHRLPPPLRIALSNALHPAFLAAACVAALVFVLVLVFLDETPLRRSLEDVPVAETLAAGAPDTGSPAAPAR